MILLFPFPHYYLVALAPLSFAIKTDRKKKKNGYFLPQNNIFKKLESWNVLPVIHSKVGSSSSFSFSSNVMFQKGLLLTSCVK